MPIDINNENLILKSFSIKQAKVHRTKIIALAGER